MPKAVIIIPSRMAAKRLPNKPLLKINNKSLIMHVYERAKESKIGDVYVATCDKKIFYEIEKNNGKCILTKKSHKSGTDRIYEALNKINNNEIDYVINLQGDEPLISISDIRNLFKLSLKNNSSVATLACRLRNKGDLFNKNVVKIITKKNLPSFKISKALDFKRTIDIESVNIYHHLGIYLYKKSFLKKFIELKQTKLEKMYRLEQMRLIENRIKIDVILGKSRTTGIDTIEDYMEIKKLMEYKS